MDAPSIKQPEFYPGEHGNYVCGWAVEKMCRNRMYNVVNPDDNCRKIWCRYARLYEMFLGPLGAIISRVDTNGIDGVHRFLRKVVDLFYREDMLAGDRRPTCKGSFEVVAKLIKKVTYDIENFSFNTSVSAFMICLNELTAHYHAGKERFCRV